MYKNRAIFSGRLSEIFGPDVINLDKFARTIGYRRCAEDTYKTLNDEYKNLMQAFADGVNDYIENIKISSESSAYVFPLEFYVFKLTDKIEPWTPIDSLASIKLISFSLTWDWAQDLLREINKMESEELRELAEELTPFTKNYLHNMVTVLDDSDVRMMGKWSDKTLSERYIENLEHLRAAEPKRIKQVEAFNSEIIDLGVLGESIDESMHSNNWVIHGNHTSTGKPMLANDPHLGTGIPSFWLLNELIWDDKFLIGASAPGIPFIGIGRGKMTSFGQTSPLCDISDLW